MITFGDAYSLSLTSPLKIGNHTLHQKEVLPFFFIEDNHRYFFELSPLLGLHKEDLSQAKESLLEYFKQGKKDKKNLTPSALFALEGAYWLKHLEDYKININGLYIPSEQSKKIVGKVLKIKIGRIDFQKEIDLINQFTKSKITLRLDANCSLTKDDLYYYWQKIENKEYIEYFEEPLKNCDELLHINEAIPIALDESLEKFYQENLPEYISTFVVKPSVVFGLDKTLELINKSHKKIVISSAFETPIQMIALMKLAQNFSHSFHGLDTLKHFQFKNFPSYLNYKDGQIIFHEKNFKL